MLKLLVLLIPCSWPYEQKPVCTSDLHRFDWLSKEFVKSQRDFARKHLTWVEGQGPLAWEWAAEARRCFEAWDALDDLKRGYEPMTKLAELRCLIGYELYYSGRMPECVPLRWFSEGGISPIP
jgi:hypothetical protein